MSKSRRRRILDTTHDLVGRFLYYDRKEDRKLPVGAIEEAIAAGEITKEEIVAVFAKYLPDHIFLTEARDPEQPS
jgi:hypothetical protein